MNQGKIISLPSLIFFILIFHMACFKIFNLDIWWHMEAGEYILKNFSIPRYDIFSHTSAGEPWVPTQWLFQVISYILYAAGGTYALILAKALLVSIIFYILLKTLREWNVPDHISISLLIFFAAVSRFRFFLRPDVASFFFMALEIYLLHRWRKRGDRLSFYLLPLNMFIWANVHSGATIGIAILALFFFASIIEFYRAGSEEFPPIKKTSSLIFISFILTLINPNGIGLYLFALEHYDIYDKIGIGESIPPSFAEFPLFYILLIPSCLVHILGIRKLPIFSILLFILFTHLSLKTARMIGWWGIAVAPSTVFACYLLLNNHINKLSPHKLLTYPVMRSTLSITIMASVFFMEVFYLTGYHNDIEFGLGLKKGKYPEKAVDFVVENNLKGNMYNDQDFGGYILWRLYPERKVFFDPRMQVYYKLFKDFNNWPGLLDKYNINYAILEYPDTFTFREIPFPEEKWSLVYWDDVAMIYVRKISQNAPIISKFGYKLLTRPYDEEFSYAHMIFKYPAFLNELKNELHRNTASVYRKNILMSAIAQFEGKMDDSRDFLSQAIKNEPKKQNAYYHLGKLHIKSGNLNEGKAYLKKCIKLASYSKYGKMASLELAKTVK